MVIVALPYILFPHRFFHAGTRKLAGLGGYGGRATHSGFIIPKYDTKRDRKKVLSPLSTSQWEPGQMLRLCVTVSRLQKEFGLTRHATFVCKQVRSGPQQRDALSTHRTGQRILSNLKRIGISTTHITNAKDTIWRRGSHSRHHRHVHSSKRTIDP